MLEARNWFGKKCKYFFFIGITGISGWNIGLWLSFTLQMTFLFLIVPGMSTEFLSNARKCIPTKLGDNAKNGTYTHHFSLKNVGVLLASFLEASGGIRMRIGTCLHLEDFQVFI